MAFVLLSFKVLKYFLKSGFQRFSRNWNLVCRVVMKYILYIRGGCRMFWLWQSSYWPSYKISELIIDICVSRCVSMDITYTHIMGLVWLLNFKNINVCQYIHLFIFTGVFFFMLSEYLSYIVLNIDSILLIGVPLA